MLVAAVVTAAALIAGNASSSPASHRLPVVATNRHSSPRPLTSAQVVAQAGLVQSECGMGGARHVPVDTQVHLRVATGGSSVRLNVVGGQAIVCMDTAGAGKSAVGPASEPAAPPHDSIAIAGSDAADNYGQHQSLVDGRVGSAVSGVEFLFSHGTARATVGDGWFVVSRPNGQAPSAEKLTTASGLRTLRLGDAAPPPVSCPRQQACTATSSLGQPVAGAAVSGVVVGRSGAIGTRLTEGLTGAGTVSSPSSRDAPGPVKTWIGPRRAPHLAVTLTKVGSA